MFSFCFPWNVKHFINVELLVVSEVELLELLVVVAELLEAVPEVDELFVVVVAAVVVVVVAKISSMLRFFVAKLYFEN